MSVPQILARTEELVKTGLIVSSVSVLLDTPGLCVKQVQNTLCPKVETTPLSLFYVVSVCILRVSVYCWGP